MGGSSSSTRRQQQQQPQQTPPPAAAQQPQRPGASAQPPAAQQQPRPVQQQAPPQQQPQANVRQVPGPMPQHLLVHQNPQFQQQYRAPVPNMLPQQQQIRPTAAVSDAVTIKNLCTIDTHDVKYDVSSKTLSFVVRSLVAATLEMHSFVRCDIKSGHCMISPNRAKPPPPTIPVDVNPAGQNYSLIIEDYDGVFEHERKFVPEYPKQFPVVILLRYQSGTENGSVSKENPYFVELTMIALQPQCRVVKQILEANGNAYLMERLFGAEHTVGTSPAPGGEVAAGEVIDAEVEGEESTCVICLTNEKNTAAMPCKHLCMCKECAGTLRSQPGIAKCPICRKEVSQFVTMRS